MTITGAYMKLQSLSMAPNSVFIDDKWLTTVFLYCANYDKINRTAMSEKP